MHFIKKISENKYRIFCTKFILLIKWFYSYDDVYNEHIIIFDYQIVKRRD